VCLHRRATPGDVPQRELSRCRRCRDAAERSGCRGVGDVPAAQEAQAVHALPDDDARAGVRQQFVHHAAEALGDRLPAAPQRAPGEGLVSEPADEEQEVERARQANDIPR